MLAPTVATGDQVTLHVGDALEVLASMPSASVHAVITDPPYAIKRIPAARFAQPAERRSLCTEPDCGQDATCHACTRAHDIGLYSDVGMLGQQSQNWHAQETHSRGYADNDPRQFQHWCSLWVSECLRVLKPGGHIVAFGGTRTWHRLATAVEDAGFDIRDSLAWLYSSGMPKSHNVERALANSAHSERASDWAGWGTTLKPAFEPIVLGRRPLDGTMVNNVATWGVGPVRVKPGASTSPSHTIDRTDGGGGPGDGKWPSNVHIDSDQAHLMRTANGSDPAPYFWVSKPNRHERVTVDGISHPTVKPLDLMRHLIRLVTPPGGLVLDPFAGSGTTVEACLLEEVNVVAIERDPVYLPLIQERVRRRMQPHTPTASDEPDGMHLF